MGRRSFSLTSQKSRKSADFRTTGKRYEPPGCVGRVINISSIAIQWSTGAGQCATFQSFGTNHWKWITALPSAIRTTENIRSVQRYSIIREYSNNSFQPYRIRKMYQTLRWLCVGSLSCSFLARKKLFQALTITSQAKNGQRQMRVCNVDLRMCCVWQPRVWSRSGTKASSWSWSWGLGWPHTHHAYCTLLIWLRAHTHVCNPSVVSLVYSVGLFIHRQVAIVFVRDREGEQQPWESQWCNTHRCLQINNEMVKSTSQDIWVEIRFEKWLPSSCVFRPNKKARAGTSRGVPWKKRLRASIGLWPTQAKKMGWSLPFFRMRPVWAGFRLTCDLSFSHAQSRCHVESI